LERRALTMPDGHTVLTKFIAHREEGSTSRLGRLAVRTVCWDATTSLGPSSFQSKYVKILTPLSYIYYHY